MSAANAKSSEPSMEEILASIRRIIADDQPKGDPAPEPAPEPVDFDEPLDLDDDMLDLAVEAAPVPQAAPELDPDELTFREIADAIEENVAVGAPVVEEPYRPEPPPMRQPVYEPPPREPETDRLTSSVTDAAVSAAFGSLATTILASNARTLEDLVQDMLRPMLKTWLDDNLPGIVERLVRAEIERVARGGRR
jgi:cell pole-organizing protein PopZ